MPLVSALAVLLACLHATCVCVYCAQRTLHICQGGVVNVYTNVTTASMPAQLQVMHPLTAATNSNCAQSLYKTY
jgi:hypothetical protein